MASALSNLRRTELGWETCMIAHAHSPSWEWMRMTCRMEPKPRRWSQGLWNSGPGLSKLESKTRASHYICSTTQLLWTSDSDDSFPPLSVLTCPSLSIRCPWRGRITLLFSSLVGTWRDCTLKNFPRENASSVRLDLEDDILDFELMPWGTWLWEALKWENVLSGRIVSHWGSGLGGSLGGVMTAFKMLIMAFISYSISFHTKGHCGNSDYHSERPAITGSALWESLHGKGLRLLPWLVSVCQLFTETLRNKSSSPSHGFFIHGCNKE